MAITNWEVVNSINFIHGIDFAAGLNLEGEFCYAVELTDGNALIAIKNAIVTDNPDVRIRTLIRRSCQGIEPFVFLRLTNNEEAYVLKIENNCNLYKLNISDINSFYAATPIESGNTTIEFGVTYNLGFQCYTLLDNSIVLECTLYNDDTQEWDKEILKVITPELASGDVGFGAFYRLGNIQNGCQKVYYDNIEIATPIAFV